MQAERKMLRAQGSASMLSCFHIGLVADHALSNHERPAALREAPLAPQQARLRLARRSCGGPTDCGRKVRLRQPLADIRQTRDRNTQPETAWAAGPRPPRPAAQQATEHI